MIAKFVKNKTFNHIKKYFYLTNMPKTINTYSNISIDGVSASNDKNDFIHKYFKITNKDECHNGYQYKDGLNILNERYINKPSGLISGFHFTKFQDIFKYLDYGCNLREVFLSADSQMVEYPFGHQLKTDKIILGKKYDLTDLSTFKLLLSHGLNIRDADDAPLKWASYNGYTSIVKYLIDNGCDVHAGNDYALRWASRYGHCDTVQLLVSAGANINAVDNCALKWACEKGHFNMVKYLVENGANIHTDNNCSLVWASCHGYLDIIEYLVKNGADINADYGRALMWASANGHLDVVKYLVENGANINSVLVTSSGGYHSYMNTMHRNYYRKNALIYAAEYGQFDVIKYLVQKNINTYISSTCSSFICDSSNDNALFFASCQANHLNYYNDNVSRWQFEKQSNILASDPCSSEFSTELGYSKFTNYFRKNKVDFSRSYDYLPDKYNYSDDLKETYYQNNYETSDHSWNHISNESWAEIIKYLIDKCMNNNHHVNNQILHQSLLAACSNNNYIAVKYITARGADIDDETIMDMATRNHWQIVEFFANIKGETVNNYKLRLACASHMKNLETVKNLVEIDGANIHTGNDYPLRYAIQNKKYDVVEYLLDKIGYVRKSNN